MSSGEKWRSRNIVIIIIIIIIIKSMFLGVALGAVLGPSLFLICINDLRGRIKSKVCLFANDTTLYIIKTATDSTQLHDDLRTLQFNHGKGGRYSTEINDVIS